MMSLQCLLAANDTFVADLASPHHHTIPLLMVGGQPGSLTSPESHAVSAARRIASSGTPV
jgi:hypothetical protein